MKAIVISQTLDTGYKRSWKIRDNGQALTFGSSRGADIKSLSTTDAGIELSFIVKNGNWYALDLNLERTSKTKTFEHLLTHGKTIQLGSSKISIEIPVKPEALQTLLTKTHSNQSANKQAYALTYYVDDQGILRDVQVQQENLVKNISSKHQKRTVYLENHDGLKKIDHSSYKKNAVITGSALILVLGLMMVPSKNDLQTEIVAPPKSAATVINLSEFKKPRIKTKGPIAEVPDHQQTNDNQEKQAKGKIAGFFKGVTAGRVSTLLGKVSAQAVKSSNVVVSNGIKAGSAPSGRALAALGNIDRAGSDWSNSAKGNIQSVNTVSKNGTGTGSIGKLQAGSTGQGGVGLIEDESEITGGLDRDVIAGVIKNYLGQILYCYERQLSARPDLFGKVSVRFTINGNGLVETQSIGDTTLKNATVEGCMLNKVATWKFPAPSGGTRVMVTYPFLFKSTN